MQIGPLIGRGRDADVYELDGRTVLRRTRDGRSLAAEAAVMEHARAAGVPVPAVHDVTPDGAIVMDRVAGPSLVDVLLRRPWRLGAAADVLAALHEAVHRAPAPPGLAPSGLPGDRLLHLDLHPLNVLISPDGPVLIDWSNARSGPPEADLAMTWLLLTTGTIEAPRPIRAVAATLRSRLAGAFLRRVDREAARRALPAAGELRLADPTVAAAEADRVRALVARNGLTNGPAYPE